MQFIDRQQYDIVNIIIAILYICYMQHKLQYFLWGHIGFKLQYFRFRNKKMKMIGWANDH